MYASNSGKTGWRTRMRQTGIAAVATVGMLVVVGGTGSGIAVAAPAHGRGHDDPNVTAPVPNDDKVGGPIHAANTLVPGGLMRPRSASPPAAGSGTPKTFKVYATREGLVGHYTANGHKVMTNDHFVSLPSGTSLSAKGKNAYSVRVCSTTTKRCAYEPVWDVGPWNTGDAYWNIKRTSWTKLPTGKPEAQAAYEDGYNGGKDQFGRKVRNPAGIDLADGTIRAGLGLSSSGWVNVTYLWTGGGIRGQVHTNGGSLNVRSGTSTSHSKVGEAGPYAQLPIDCQVKGQLITTGTRSSTWYHIGTGNYVSAAYVTVPAGVTIKAC